MREQIGGGQKLVERLIQNGFPLTAAFWRKTDDDSRWRLYLVTPLVAERGPFEAYRQIQTAIDSCQWAEPAEMIDTSMIHTLETTHSLAKLVGFYARGNAGRIDIWIDPEWVRDGAVTGTYIYALAPSPTPAGKN